MTQPVTAAVFRKGEADALIEPIEMGELRADEVLVKMVATGICHTDLTCAHGFMELPRPIILGHEGAAIVEAIGNDVKTIAVGDHVVMSFLPCGECAGCARGKPSTCHNFMAANLTGRRLDGSTAARAGADEVSSHFFGQSSFATHSVANERNLIRVRHDAPLHLLGPLGCGIQAGAGSVMNVLKPGAGDSIAIFGAGGVGLSAVMAAAVEGCATIVVIEPSAERRALALELGATHVIDPAASEGVVEQIAAAAPAGLDHALDSCGIPDVIGQALAALGAGGQLVLMTANTLDAVLQVPLLGMVGRSVSIHGVNMGGGDPKQFIPRLVDLVVDGGFPLHKFVRFYDFADINQALADQEQGSVVKPVLLFPA